jgi:hypothetical protein
MSRNTPTSNTSTPHGLPFDPMASCASNKLNMNTVYANRYNVPVDVYDRGVTHQINSNQYYNNKEGWNTQQFNRNNQYVNLYNDAHTRRYEDMNILFSDNYNTQRKEALDQFNKRNRSVDASQVGTQSNARFGFVDFQDPEYRNYLHSRQIKRTVAKDGSADGYVEPCASNPTQNTFYTANFQGYMPQQRHTR